MSGNCRYHVIASSLLCAHTLNSCGAYTHNYAKQITMCMLCKLGYTCVYLPKYVTMRSRSQNNFIYLSPINSATASFTLISDCPYKSNTVKSSVSIVLFSTLSSLQDLLNISSASWCSKISTNAIVPSGSFAWNELWSHAVSTVKENDYTKYNYY